MNICAVRVLLERADMKVTMEQRGKNLPHEPNSEQRFALEDTEFGKAHDGFAACKHCGSVYEVEE